MTARGSQARELKITEDDVRAEHDGAVHVRLHWLYLVAVVGGGLLLMMRLMFVLGGTSPSG
jgi:hypothetical protein